MCPEQEDGEEKLAFLLQDAFGNQEEKQIRGKGELLLLPLKENAVSLVVAQDFPY